MLEGTKMNILDTHYVKLHPGTREACTKDGVAPTAHPKLAEIITKLHTHRPTWEFVFVGRSYGGKLSKFEVRQNGEILGEVESTYIRRLGEHGLEVHNQRIDRAMQRGSSYKTGDVDKAVAKIKKMFGVKSVAERLADAVNKVSQTVDKNARNKHYNMSAPSREVETAMLEFANGPGYADFMYHLENGIPHGDRNRIVAALEKRDQLQGELVAIEEVQKAIGTPNSVMVLKTDSGYIFKRGDQTDVLTDATLPEAVRGGLGLLKLVDTEHYIAGVGARIDEDLFIVLMKE